MTPIRRIIIATFAGALLGAGTYIDQGWIVGAVGLATVLIVMRGARIRTSLYAGILSGTLAGLVSLWYFWDAYPLEWVPGMSALSGAAVIGTVWFLTAVLWGVAAVTFFVPYAVASRRVGMYALLLAPILLPFSEYIRSWLYSFYTIGEQSVLGPYFAIGNAGYLLADSALFLPVARGGVYVLSATVGILALVVAYAFLWRHTRWGITLASVMLMLVPVSILYQPTYTPSRDVTALVATSAIGPGPVSHEERMRLIGDIRERATAEAAGHAINYVMVPEDTRFLMNQSPTEVATWLASLNLHASTTLIDPTRIQDAQATKADSLVRTYQAGVLAIPYHKRLLMPLGEYVPSVHRALFKLLGFTEELARLEADRNYRKGPLSIERNDLAFFVCFELYSYPLLKETQGNHPRFVVNPSSLAVFHGSPLLQIQMHRAAKVAARMIDAPIVVPINHGTSFIVDRHGTLLPLATPVARVEI